jgi:hypothetical protein
MEHLQLSDTPMKSAVGSPKAVPMRQPNCLKHIEHHEMVLLVHVKNATDIIDTDEFSDTDPYLDVTVVNEETGKVIAHRCTATMEDNLNPHWNELLIIDATDIDLAGGRWSLKCTVYDHDECEADEAVGNVKIDLNNPMPHILKMADLGNCATSWTENEAHTYKLKDVPAVSQGGVGLACKQTRFMDDVDVAAPNTKLTISVVRAKMRDFEWWCNRIGLNAKSATSRGAARAVEIFSRRTYDSQNEDIEERKAQEARAYLQSRVPKKNARRNSMEVLFDPDGTETKEIATKNTAVLSPNRPMRLSQMKDRRTPLDEKSLGARQAGNRRAVSPVYPLSPGTCQPDLAPLDHPLDHGDLGFARSLSDLAAVEEQYRSGGALEEHWRRSIGASQMLTWGLANGSPRVRKMERLESKAEAMKRDQEVRKMVAKKRALQTALAKRARKRQELAPPPGR